MTTRAGQLSRSDLYYAADYRLSASGVFQFLDATYSVRFDTEAGLLHCLDLMLSMPAKPATPRLVLRPQGYNEKQPEWPVSGVRFDFDIHHQVAAAVLLALDKNATTHTWMTDGNAGVENVALTHDSWDPENKPLPPASFITIAQLRDVLREWAFGDALPPRTVRWIEVPHDSIGW